MSDAVTYTGILVKRKTITPPATVAITSSAIGTPGILTAGAPHLLTDKSTITIAGHTGSTPAIAGAYTARVLSATTFTLEQAGVPVNVTVGGTGGTIQANYVTIGEITKVTPPGFERNKIPSTTHNEMRESNKLGILLQRDAAFTINYIGNNATHMAILDDIINNIENQWQVALKSGITYSAKAAVQRFQLADAPVDAIQAVDCAITWAEPIVTVVPA